MNSCRVKTVQAGKTASTKAQNLKTSLAGVQRTREMMVRDMTKYSQKLNPLGLEGQHKDYRIFSNDTVKPL